MKKNFTLFKVLLVAIGLLGGVSAWAGDVTTIYERGTTTTTAWANGDLTDWVLSGDNSQSSIVSDGLKFEKTTVSRSEYTYTKSLTTTDQAIVSMDLVWNVANANGSATAGCYFILGDVKLFWCGQNRNLDIIIGGTTKQLISGGATTLRGTTFNVELSINKATKDVAYSITNSSYNSGAAITGSGTVNSSDVNSIVFGWSRGGQQNTSSQIVTSIKIAEEAQDVKEASYTINYKSGDKIVKTVSSSSVVGAEITAATAIDGEGDYAGNHYLIVANETPSMTLTAGSNEMNVPVRVPYTATLSVTTSINGASTVANTTLTETDAKVCSWSFSYPKYEKSGDVYYVCDETSYVQSGTFTNGETISKTVTYTTADASIMSFTDVGTNGTDGSYSGGSYTNINSQMASCTLNSGVYKAEIMVVSKAGSGSNHRTESVMVGGKAVASTTNGTNGLFESNFVVSSDGTEVYVIGNGSSNYTDNLDYVLIRKLYDVTNASAIVGNVNFTSEANSVRSADYTMKKGETKVFTFQNHGTTYGNNWRIEVKEGEEWKSNTCADSYDYTAGTATNVTSYKESRDGGVTQTALDWNHYVADMADARVVATLTYGTDGTLAIRTTSTGSANGYIYYVDHDVTGLTGDLTINLSVCKSWLEVLSVEQTAVAVSVSDYGYATLCPSYNLDFSNVEGIEACKAEVADSKITYTKVNTVAAGEGVLLRSTAGGAATVSVPVIASATANADNAFVGIPEKVQLAQSTEAGYTNYILSVVNNEFGFYKVNSNGSWVKAGSAYLKVANTNAANLRGFIPVVDSETTGIAGVEAEKAENGAAYNMAGQRVDGSYKGIVIKNGKKVFVR